MRVILALRRSRDAKTLEKIMKNFIVMNNTKFYSILTVIFYTKMIMVFYKCKKYHNNQIECHKTLETNTTMDVGIEISYHEKKTNVFYSILTVKIVFYQLKIILII